MSGGGDPVAAHEERRHVERQIGDAVLDLDVLLVKDEGRVEEVGARL